MNSIGLFLFVVVIFIITFLPSLVAYKRNHKNFLPILILNAFFGWTCIGWVGCLVWAFLNKD